MATKRQYTWDEYYEKFFDWAESTRAKNLYALTSLGPSDQVAELIFEMGGEDAANRLLKRAVNEKLAFRCDELVLIANECDEDLTVAAAYNSVSRLSDSDMDELYDVLPEEAVVRICLAKKALPPTQLHEKIDNRIATQEKVDRKWQEVLTAIPEEEDEEIEPPGFLKSIFAYIGLKTLMRGSQTRRGYRMCDGNCAKCPPHYGYRYSRWYYGHHHVHGCEFGGNDGSGGSD